MLFFNVEKRNLKFEFCYEIWWNNNNNKIYWIFICLYLLSKLIYI